MLRQARGMRIVRHPIFVFILALLLALGGPGAVAAQDAPAPSPIETVRQGFDLLMDRFFRPLGSDALLAAAWKGATDEVGTQPRSPLEPAEPPLTGSRERDWAAFGASWEDLARQPDADSTRLARAAVRAMVALADEGHTVFMDPQRYAEHQAWSRGDVRYGGIGARMTGEEPTIIEVFEGSPAEAAGLQPGDVITHVNGQRLEPANLTSTINQVRGPAGTEVVLTVRRPGGEPALEIHITRAEIQLQVVSKRMLPDQVAYVQLRGFPEPSVVEKVRQAIADLREEGARALVLDLRGNSGGRLDVGRRMLSLFITAGPLYQQVSREGSSFTANAIRSADKVDLPMAVLVDGGTASMGEIFAAAMQEHAVALVIGENTAGSVAAGQVFPLPDGSALQVTVMEIRTGQGKVLNAVGVEPDVMVTNTLEDIRQGRDSQLNAAIEHLARPVVGPTTGLVVPLFGARFLAA
jgi:carboxyl-terminal processing protease